MRRTMFLPTAVLLAILTSVYAQRCRKNAASHEFEVGAIRGVIISNGPTVTPIQPFTVPDQIVNNAYEKCFRSSNPFVWGQNVVVLDLPGKRIMIDTGAKPNANFPFWMNTGKMLTNLLAAGIDPSSINIILLTHGHADHVNGLIDDAGDRVFPNANVYIGNTEHSFWTAPAPDPTAQIALPTFLGLQAIYTASTTPYQLSGKLNVVSNTFSPCPGVEFMPAPGHTPGHNYVKVTVGSDVLVISADTWVSKPDQLQHPTWKFSFDTHPQLAIQSRRNLLRLVHTNRYAVIAYHEAFPGLGYVAGSRYRYDWVPAPIDLLGDGVTRTC